MPRKDRTRNGVAAQKTDDAPGRAGLRGETVRGTLRPVPLAWRLPTPREIGGGTSTTSHLSPELFGFGARAPFRLRRLGFRFAVDRDPDQSSEERAAGLPRGRATGPRKGQRRYSRPPFDAVSPAGQKTRQAGDGRKSRARSIHSRYVIYTERHPSGPAGPPAEVRRSK